jgi:hypothetical protein
MQYLHILLRIIQCSLSLVQHTPASQNGDTCSVPDRSVFGFGCVKADLNIACRAHAVPMPWRGAEGLECFFPIWLTQCGRVWFTLAMPRPCRALTMLFFSRPRHSTAVERRTVGYLPAFGFFRLPRGVPRSLLSEAYHSSSQRSIPTTVKSGSSTLQKRLAVRVFPATTRTFT